MCQADASPDFTTLMRAHEFFAGLDEQALAQLVAGGEVVTFDKGEHLLREGDESDSALLLYEGAIAVVAETEFGSATLAELSGVCLLGEIGVYARLPRSATLRALTTARVLRIGREAMLRLCYNRPEFPLRIIQQLAGRLHSFNKAIATYADALAALDADTDNARIVDALLAPPPELANFAVAFRRMATLITRQRRQREEMASAVAIQNALLPLPLPADPRGRFRLDAIMQPARHVGGDFFDAFVIGPDEVVVTIGDVSGKGVPASLFATVCQMVMRLVLRESHGLGEAVAKANDLIASANRESMFATFFVARLDLATGDMSFCNAGHIWPIVRRADGRCDYLPGKDLPLAVMDQVSFAEERTRLYAGDRLVLCTDGVLEAIAANDEDFGQERLLSSVVGLSHDTVDPAQNIVDAVQAFSRGVEQFDDIACLILDFAGGDTVTATRTGASF